MDDAEKLRALQAAIEKLKIPVERFASSIESQLMPAQSLRSMLQHLLAQPNSERARELLAAVLLDAARQLRDEMAALVSLLEKTED